MKTRQDDGEIDCKVMRLIEPPSGQIMNKILGVEEQTNRGTWVDSIARILGICPKAE